MLVCASVSMIWNIKWFQWRFLQKEEYANIINLAESAGEATSKTARRALGVRLRDEASRNRLGSSGNNRNVAYIYAHVHRHMWLTTDLCVQGHANRVCM